ncbi:MAG TPA: prepilin-type N-terminal cleavage/methylation domain-containing protein [Gemmataceae bacterium]|nr:prepilin-type N-terminal cleavage/methylation domain-containing protein [Gemmataceae bacterium]
MPPLLCAAVPAPHRRPAFTLMELMVAMFILLILAGIGVYVVQNINSDAGAPRGAVTLQQALMIAKQDALRSQRNTGVRLSLTTVPDPANTSLTLTVSTDVQFIQEPDPFGVQASTTTGAPFRAIQSASLSPNPNPGLDFVDLVPDPVATYGDFSGNVQSGDYLIINDGVPHRIALVNQAPTTSGTRLQLASPLPLTLQPTSNYIIRRAPRPTGEDPIQLPLNIAIDIGTNTTYSQPLPTDPISNTIDIVFAPSGAVVARGLSSADAIYLWVRDSTLPLFRGDNTIVAVSTRTGMVAAHPADSTAGGDPYSFTKDGRASGN